MGIGLLSRCFCINKYQGLCIRKGSMTMNIRDIRSQHVRCTIGKIRFATK